MKELKFLLNLLTTAAYTSAIWGTAVFWPPTDNMFAIPFFIVMVIGGVYIVGASVSYLIYHWKDKD